MSSSQINENEWKLKNHLGDHGQKKKIRKEERRRQTSITNKRRRIANREIFTLIEMAVKASPYHGTGNQIHKV